MIPELYARVKQRIARRPLGTGRRHVGRAGSEHPERGVPDSADVYMVSVSIMEEFGKTSQIEWLPDTFGYCASLPQILKHGGC